MFGHIMVPYDKSEPANRALEFAIDLAKKYNSKISVVACAPLHFAYSTYIGASYVEAINAIKKDAEDSLSKLESKLKDSKVSYDTKVTEGISITDSLISYGDSHGIDLIVMGSRGLGGFKKLLLGSVASGISQHSKCPVLIVK